jgi:hypothetical protein
LWDQSHNRRVLQAQADRRQAVLKQLADMLADLRARTRR